MSYEEQAVAAKLRDSLAAHDAARTARQRHDTATATAELRRAYTLRADAHLLDPEHTSPAWQTEDSRTARGRNTHDDLMAFYRQQLDKERTNGQQPADQQSAAESAAQPVEPEPLAADPAQSEPEQPAAEPAESERHATPARVTKRTPARKARHG